MIDRNFLLVFEDNSIRFTPGAVHDEELVYYWHEFINSPEGSSKKLNAQKELLDIVIDRMHVYNKKGTEVLRAVQQTGQPLVDDWDCLKSMVRIFETHCGSLSEYGMKHTRVIANICNAGINNETMTKVSAEVCSYIPSTRRSSLCRGFRA
ncbi:hypothetical protein KFK09_024245 [Dendrobium nobile]|uniref:Legumain prodomain domain-containing protein n=1 Tax=Dendrobium nobile TaxID=94219 RepID=A0A8T3ADJ8_DENNO|nr:hypothetical protein KFK09_024245 [Dendrobium nobile]